MRSTKLYTIVLTTASDKSLLCYVKRQIVVKLQQTTNRLDDKSLIVDHC